MMARYDIMMSMMVRTQIQFTPGQLKALRHLSAESGKSIADLVRQAVDRELILRGKTGREMKIQRALRAVGKFASGIRDTSLQHDRYIADAMKR